MSQSSQTATISAGWARGRISPPRLPLSGREAEPASCRDTSRDVAPYDEAELQRLRGVGVDDPEGDPTVRVQAPGGQPNLFFQRVPDITTTGFPPNRHGLTGSGNLRALARLRSVRRAVPNRRTTFGRVAAHPRVPHVRGLRFRAFARHPADLGVMA